MKTQGEARRLFVLASNLDLSRDDGISNSVSAYLEQYRQQGLRLDLLALPSNFGSSWVFRHLMQLVKIRARLTREFASGDRCVVEGYKAALLCLGLRNTQNVLFVIHDAGSKSHRRLWKFWLRRLHWRAFERMWRELLDLVAEQLVLRNRAVAVVSQAEAAKVSFTDNITIMPPSGLPQPGRKSSVLESQLVPTPNSIILYADLRAAHLRESALEGLRTLTRAGVSSPYQLVILGRRKSPRSLVTFASKVFLGGVVDAEYVSDLKVWLTSAEAVWLPDLVGSGVKNRALDALRYARRTIATDVALEGIGYRESESVRVYRTAQELTAVFSDRDSGS
jgi:hypothetical protein